MTGLIALLVGASVGASVALAYRRRTLGRLIRQVAGFRDTLDQAAVDAALADWCRHMNLTVIGVSGAEFTTSLAQLHESEAPTMRSWNVPISVTVWSDRESDLIVPGRDGGGQLRG